MPERDVQTLLVSQSEGWLTVTLNRPEARNALSGELVGELTTVIEDASDDPDIRGLSLRGAGGVFCAGADLKELLAIADAKTENGGPAEGGKEALARAVTTSTNIAHLLKTLRTSRLVTIAVVEGAAMAGGFGLACACDFVLTTETTKFSLSETRIGLVAAQIAPYVLERLGPVRARQFMMVGTTVLGAQACAIGLADRQAETREELTEIEAEMIARTRKCAPGAVATTKRLLDHLSPLDRDAYIHLASDAFSAALAGEEGREGVASFVEKRKPLWAQTDGEG